MAARQILKITVGCRSAQREEPEAGFSCFSGALQFMILIPGMLPEDKRIPFFV